MQVERLALDVHDDGFLEWSDPGMARYERGRPFAEMLDDGSIRRPLGPVDSLPDELPDGWIFHDLADTDLDDNGQLADLVETFGIAMRPYFGGFVPADRWPLMARPGDPDAGRWWANRTDGRLEDARWWLKTARALVGMWVAAHDGDDLRSAWTAEGFVNLPSPLAPDLVVVPGVWALFASALDEGLRAFHARAEIRFAPGIVVGAPRVDLFSAACRQIFNLIVTHATPRRCENATCGRVFVHQVGGAEYGQYRTTGVRFCSPRCARAETQRQYRRREAAKRKGEQ